MNDPASQNVPLEERCVACRKDAPRVTDAEVAELKPLMGLEQPPPARAKKSAPAPAPAPTADSSQPGMSAAQSRAANCMAQNAQKHQKEIEALAQRAQAAQQANDMNQLMAIADSIQKLQSAGCQ